MRLLEEEAYEDLGAALTEAAPPEAAWIGPPASLVRRLLSELARSYREHRGVFRTILLKSRSDPERQRRRMDFTSEFLRVSISHLQAATASLEPPPSERAWRVALLFASSALRDAILFDEDWWADTSGEVRDEVLVGELTSAMLAYLGIPRE